MEKMNKVFFMVILFFIMFGSVVGYATQTVVTSEQSFLEALSDENISVIELKEAIHLNLKTGTDDAFVINRDVTIKGGTLTLEHAGIVLGGDVTFENVTLGFTNLVRNGIFANGNHLTLNGVKKDNSVKASIHVFCGGVTGYNEGNELPSTASEGKITIKGNNVLGHVLAGSLSDDNANNNFAGSATIIIEDDASGSIGNIYAHGACESRGTGEGDVLNPSSTNYTVSGNVNINLNKALTLNVDCDTGSSKDAIFTYSDEKGYECKPILANVGELNIIKGNLVPNLGSSFSNEDISVLVEDNAILNISNLGSSVNIKNFSGGGKLVLGANQLLRISGDVIGITDVSISTEELIEGEVYIIAINSQEDSFNLIPINSEILLKDSEGNWTVGIKEKEIIITDISIISSLQESAGCVEAVFPITVNYQTEDESNGLWYIPIKLSINSKFFDIEYDSSYGYYYITRDDIEVEPVFDWDEEKEVLKLYGIGEAAIPQGTYNILITIPKENMESGVEYELEAVLTIEDTVELQSIAIPNPQTGLKYNGNEQTGVLDGTGYSLEGNKGTDAENYTAIATLLAGYQWEDGTTIPQSINWSIEKADGIASITLEGWAEGESPKNPVPLSNTNGVDAIIYQYKLNTQEDSAYTTVKPLVAGEYKVKAIFSETKNYKEVVAYADFMITHTHSGGTATCTSLAICEGCKQPYGEKDSNNHTYGNEWSKDELKHWHECVCGEKKDEKIHTPGDEATEEKPQICIECEYIIKAALGHSHSGGTATCTSLAKCDGCGMLYGSKDSNNHTDTTEVRNAVEATSKKNGYTGDTYYKCCNLKVKTGKVIPKKSETGSSEGGGGGSSKPDTKKENSIVNTEKIKDEGIYKVETIAIPEANVTNYTATLELSEKISQEIIKQVVDKESDVITIKPEVNGYISKLKLSMLSSTINNIANDTGANLRVETPIASISLSNKILDGLNYVKDAVNIIIEKNQNNVELKIIIDDEVIEELGDIILTVPYEDGNPGTVVEIINENGINEIIKKSKFDSENNIVTVPLNGSSKIKIIDNGKEFQDTKKDDWYYGAVEFVSSRMIFGGTSDKVFSPNEVMTRGMLAQVLYNLENNPEYEAEGGFYDVSVNSWYENAINWAADAKIISGYGDGLFGPKDPVSREQLAVMLWKYSGTPKSNHSLKHFIDKEDISEYAKPALLWANENKIITGKGANILDPKGKATRAEVAQMIKNFIENN